MFAHKSIWPFYNDDVINSDFVTLSAFFLGGWVGISLKVAKREIFFQM